MRHPEINYFRETVYDEKANLQNRLALFTVKFNNLIPDIFASMPGGLDEKFDPEPKSLYNLQTMKQLCEIGEKVPNILREPEETID